MVDLFVNRAFITSQSIWMTSIIIFIYTNHSILKLESAIINSNLFRLLKFFNHVRKFFFI